MEEKEPSLAVWAKVCGILSFFIGWLFLGITAIVLANLSKDETNGVMCPAARTGHTCGIISSILSGVLFIIYIAVIVTLTI